MDHQQPNIMEHYKHLFDMPIIFETNRMKSLLSVNMIFVDDLWVLSTTKYKDKNNGMMKQQFSNDEQNEEKGTCPDQG